MESPICITLTPRKLCRPHQLPDTSFNSALTAVLSIATSYNLYARVSLSLSTKEKEGYLPGCPLFFYINANILNFHVLYRFLQPSQVMKEHTRNKIPHKYHPSIFLLRLQDTNNGTYKW